MPYKDKLDPGKVRKALYRPLDTRHVYDDPAWIDWYREDLHAVYANGEAIGYEVTIAAYPDSTIGGNAKVWDTALKTGA